MNLTLEGRIVGVSIVRVKFEENKVEYAFQTERLVDVKDGGEFFYEFLEKMNKDDNKRFPLLRFASPFTEVSDAATIGYLFMDRKELVRIHTTDGFQKIGEHQAKPNGEARIGTVDLFSIGVEFDTIDFAVANNNRIRDNQQGETK